MSAAGRNHSLKCAADRVQRLTSAIVSKQHELDRRENSSGTSHDVRKMNRLRTEIDALERKLRLAEIAQDMEIARAK